MDNRILVPLEGTESIDEVLLYVQSITPREETEIRLLHVLPMAGADGGAEEHVNNIRSALTTAGWTVTVG